MTFGLLLLAIIGLSLIITGVMELRARFAEAARWASIETAYRNGASATADYGTCRTAPTPARCAPKAASRPGECE